MQLVFNVIYTIKYCVVYIVDSLYIYYVKFKYSIWIFVYILILRNKKQVCETTGISPSEIFSSNNEEVVDARYLLIHLLCDKFTDKEIANMTGISKSLANKIRNTIHVKKNKYSFRCKLKEIKEKLGDKCPEIFSNSLFLPTPMFSTLATVAISHASLLSVT